MKKLLWIALILFMITYAGMSYARDQTDTVAAQASGSGKDWKQEFASDKEAIKGVHDTMKSNADAARQEERSLRERIKQARESGDMETAKSLEAQLKSTHAENVQQKKQNMSALKEARQDMKQDKKQARQDRVGLPPPRRDNDNNPPGPRGGPGTNWENKPGPQGGPGASPDRGNRGVRDRGQGQGRDGRGQGGEHRSGGVRR